MTVTPLYHSSLRLICLRLIIFTSKGKPRLECLWNKFRKKFEIKLGGLACCSSLIFLWKSRDSNENEANWGMSGWSKWWWLGSNRQLFKVSSKIKSTECFRWSSILLSDFMAMFPSRTNHLIYLIYLRENLQGGVSVLIKSQVTGQRHEIFSKLIFLHRCCSYISVEKISGLVYIQSELSHNMG